MTGKHREIAGWEAVAGGQPNWFAARPICGADIPKPKFEVMGRPAIWGGGDEELFGSGSGINFGCAPSHGHRRVDPLPFFLAGEPT